VRVSVIIPLYNKAKYITRTLRSVAGQTFEDFETIIVDDGSSDGSGELASEFPDRRFRVLRQANAGPGAARNRGIKEARGEVIAFLDADDEWMPEYLESGLKMLAEFGPEVAAVTSGYLIQPDNISSEPLWRKRGLSTGALRVTPDISCHKLAHLAAFMAPSTTIFRRAMIERWGGFYAKNSCRYAEDQQLCLKVLLNDAVLLRLEPLVNRDFSASQLSRNFAGPRPVEPFLLDPEDVEKACPPELVPLLRRYYARCACKTATVLGLWGDTAAARSLVRQYVRVNNTHPAFLLMALFACTPVADLLGRVILRSRVASMQRGNPFWGVK
jgi:glycosyltransferase involved in cell wall biosynthesis